MYVYIYINTYFARIIGGPCPNYSQLQKVNSPFFHHNCIPKLDLLVI